MKKKLFFLLFLLVGVFPFSKVHAIDVVYQAHVQDYGWLKEVKNGEIGGTSGQSKRVEALKIRIDNNEYDGDIVYQAHVQDYGWLKEVGSFEIGGTSGQSKRVEAFKIRLTGELGSKYDVYYRAHVQDYGWLSWVKNGEIGGTTGKSKRVEAMEIKLVSKEDINASLTYSVHNNIGWMNYVNEGEIGGTVGESRKLDGIKIKLENNSSYKGNINYEVYSSINGWQDKKSNNEPLVIEKDHLEAIKIYLTDELSEQLDVFYRVHVSNIGWMDYTSNGKVTGTIGLFNHIEAVEIKLQDKNSTELKDGEDYYRESINKITYSSHVSNIGWMDYVNDGELSGTTGRSLQVESFKVKLETKIPGNISYNTYVTRRGWSDYISNDEVAGTTGLSRSIEAIKIKLEGEISNYYDIYYRTHVSNIGWLSWAKNDEASGCLNSNQRIEALEIKLVKKGSEFSGNTSKPLATGKWKDNYYYDYFGNVATGFKLIDGVKYYFNSEGRMYGKNVDKIIDVSSWQETIDWDRIKREDDVDGAIIRVGWGTRTGEECGLDSYFDRNIKAVQRLEIPYSIYIYAYVSTEESAEQEA